LGIYYTSTQDVSADQATVNWNQDQSVPSGLLTFTKNDNLFTVLERSVAIQNIFSKSTLISQSHDCGTNYNIAYYDTLFSKFANTDRATEYEFRYNGESQEPTRWLVTILPNKPNYGDLKDFENDFNICGVGGDYYPIKLNQDYLLFESACGSGAGDGTDRPYGCDAIREAVEPTMQMK